MNSQIRNEPENEQCVLLGRGKKIPNTHTQHGGTLRACCRCTDELANKLTNLKTKQCVVGRGVNENSEHARTTQPWWLEIE
jgi:hypothetical protein